MGPSLHARNLIAVEAVGRSRGSAPKKKAKSIASARKIMVSVF